MDPVFQQSLDEVINEDLRMKASEATKGSHPTEDISPAHQQALKDAPTWWDYSRSFIEGAGQIADRMSVQGAATSALRTVYDAAQPTGPNRFDLSSVPKSDPIGTVVTTAAAKAAYETADFVQEVAGVNTDAQKPSAIRQGVQDLQDQAIAAGGKPAAVVAPIAQFVAGILGAGKLLAPLKVANMGVKAKGAFIAAESAVASSLAFDGHEERLSNLIQDYPALENPVSAYLAASPEDTEMEGRMKAALEDLGLGAIAGGFLTSLKVIKLGRMGDTEAASALASQLADDDAVAQAVKAADEGLPPEAVPVAAEKPRVRVKAGNQYETAKALVQGDGKASASYLARKLNIKQEEAAKLLDQMEKDGIVSAMDKRVRRTVLKKIQQPTMTGTDANPGKAADDAAGAQPSVTITQNTDPNLRSDPKKPLVPELISEQDAADIVRNTEFDILRMEQTYGDRTDAMIQSGNALAPRKGIPWQKVNTTQDGELLVARVVEATRPELAKMKGGEVLKDAQVRSRVRNMTRWYNSDPDLVVADLAKAGDEAGKMVQRMEAGYTISVGAFNDAYKVLQDIRLGNFGPYGGTKEAAISEMRKRMNFAVNVYGSARSLTANAARAVRYMRFAVDEKAVKSLNSLADEDFMRLLETTGGDPKKLKEVATPSVMRRFMEQVQFSQRNGLLWYYPTHVVNITGNVLMQVFRPLEKVIGSTVQAAWKPGIAKDIRDGALREYGYMTTSVFDGLKAGLEAGLKGDSLMHPHATDMFGGEGDLFATKHVDLTNIQWSRMDSFTGMAANAYKAYNILSGIPTRALGAQDEFFKMLSYRGTVQSKAWVEGNKMGLKGADLTNFIEERLKKAFDESGRAVDPEALNEAQTRTFNQELLPNTLGFGLRNLRASYPALGFVLPFMKTPINVLRYAHKYTPMLNMAQKEYRMMLFGKMGSEKQAQAIGQMAMGSMLVTAASTMAANGMITGGGPRDPQLKAQMLQDGWKPYAFKVEVGGKTEFIPFGRLDPIGLPMGIAADMWEIYTADPDNEELQNAATATAIALAKNFSERTFLLNVNMLMDAMADPEANMGKFLGGTLRSTVPFSSAMKGYANQDPYLRDARTLMDRMMQDVPGYSANIPPKRHAVLGYPLLKNLGLTSSRQHRPVEDELMRLALETDNGIYPPNPVRNSVDLRELRLKDNRTAYDILQENAGNEHGELNRAGQKLPPLRKALEDLMKSKEYQAMEDGGPGIAATKLNAISGIVQNYREAAFGVLMLDYPEVKQKVLMRDIQAKGEFLMNMGKPGAAQSLLNAIGVPSK